MKKGTETEMWVELSAWLHSHRNLKGSRMVLGMMDQWAESVNVFEHVFGCEHEDAVIYSGDCGYPLVEVEIEMADAKTISDCKWRLEKLKAIAKVRNLTQEEEEEQSFIISYLKEVSFQGRPRKFSDSPRHDYQRNFENLHYAIARLGEDHPDLAEYVMRHVQTSPVFRWI